MKFVEFNNFVGKLVEVMSLRGDIEGVATIFDKNSDEETYEVRIMSVCGECSSFAEFTNYFDKNNSDYNHFQCYFVEKCGSDEIVKYFDNKEQLVSHIIDMSVIDSLSM